ncbi:MAG TPA: MarR family transcriptional regulator [Syntrophomonadaceae bacterium]|nr:MarR family transcriptional regulator [Syntrophomonadaceae bacterium]
MDTSQPLTETIDPSAGELLHLILKTNNFVHKQIEVELSRHNLPPQLTGPRLRVLMEISAAGRLKMSELAAKLGVRARTVTQFVDVLEKDNFLVRLPDTSDRRATLLQLTEMAERIIAEAQIVMDSVSEKLLENITLVQRKQLCDILLCIISDKE